MQQRLTSIVEGLRSGRFVNEAAISQGAVLPILDALGWSIFDPRSVAPEYAVGGRRVDFALLDITGRPCVFIEVKRPGLVEGGDIQLFEYAFHEGVPTAVLTDGQEWSVYLPAAQGSYDERRVYKLDLLERDLAESEQRLHRYLEHDRVLSGQALTDARADYTDAARGRQIRSTLPPAWERLMQDRDQPLIELLADKVEDLCGYRPSVDDCAVFLAQRPASFVTVAPRPAPEQPPRISVAIP